MIECKNVCMHSSHMATFASETCSRSCKRATSCRRAVTCAETRVRPVRASTGRCRERWQPSPYLLAAATAGPSILSRRWLHTRGWRGNAARLRHDRRGRDGRTARFWGLQTALRHLGRVCFHALTGATQYFLSAPRPLRASAAWCVCGQPSHREIRREVGRAAAPPLQCTQPHTSTLRLTVGSVGRVGSSMR